MKTEIANILREAADKIEAVCVPTTPVQLHELPTVPALPDPPEGFHPAMRGSIPCPAARHSSDIVRFECGQWHKGPWTGETLSAEVFYALRKGSDIAKLNGLEEDTKQDTARREWQIRVADDSNEKYPQGTVVSGHHGDREDGRPHDKDQWDYVTVREVLPGDPTPEQVEDLVKAATRAIAIADRDGLILGGLEKALAPFRKP